MIRSEIRTLGRLTGRALAAVADGIGEVHQVVANRVFDAVGPQSAPVRLVHNQISELVYASVRIGVDLGARFSALALAAKAAHDNNIADHPDAARILAFLNGIHGDLLAVEYPELAFPMTVRCQGGDVRVEAAALAEAFPQATPRLAVFVHGLVETEASWHYRARQHHGEPGVTYGTLLRRDLDYTPVYVRYNSGLRISANGAALDGLLEQLAAHWPVPVQELVLIGHSVGGLVVRSALAQGGDGTARGERRWPGCVRATVMLGSPHLGAPLEVGGNFAVYHLAQLAETRPLAAWLRRRSVGIKDLRFGNLVEQDWAGLDPDSFANARTDVCLHPGARHFVVVASVAGAHDTFAGNLLGDLFVQPKSACGDTGDERQLAFPANQVCRLAGLNHFDLLNHPEVYEQLHAWLAAQPD